MGHRLIQVVPEQPQPIEPLGQSPHEFALAAHVLMKEQKHQLQQNRRSDRGVAVAAVRVRHHRTRERKVDHRTDPAQGMIRSRPALKIDLITKQSLLPLVWSHHDARFRRHSALRVLTGR
jgi:hypothetical protein